MSLLLVRPCRLCSLSISPAPPSFTLAATSYDFLTLHVQLDRHVPWCMCMSLCMIDASAWFWNLYLSPGYTESSVFFFFFQTRTFRVWLAHAQHIRVVSGPLTLLCASSRWVWPFPAVMGVSDDYRCVYYYLRIVRNALPACVRGGSACLGSPSSFSGTTLYWHQVGLAILSARHVLTHSCVFLAIFMWSEMLCRCLCMFGVLTWLLD